MPHRTERRSVRFFTIMISSRDVRADRLAFGQGSTPRRAAYSHGCATSLERKRHSFITRAWARRGNLAHGLGQGSARASPDISSMRCPRIARIETHQDVRRHRRQGERPFLRRAVRPLGDRATSPEPQRAEALALEGAGPFDPMGNGRAMQREGHAAREHDGRRGGAARVAIARVPGRDDAAAQVSEDAFALEATESEKNASATAKTAAKAKPKTTKKRSATRRSPKRARR